MEEPLIPGECRGGYVLFLNIDRSVNVECGSLGMLSLKRGVYLYVGSSVGRGGVKSRLRRHLKTGKKLRWHIDFLTSIPEVEVVGAIWICGVEGVEDLLYNALLSCKFEVPILKFGSSDTKHLSHLFYSDLRPLETMCKLLAWTVKRGFRTFGFLTPSLLKVSV